MKTFNIKIWALAAISLVLTGTSCTSDLDKEPISPKIHTVYSSDGLFNKCYANFAMAGSGYGDNGDAGSDVKGYKDEGMTNLYRLMWNANELTTDEAICGWGDNGLDQLVVNTYDNSNQMMKAYFSRLTIGISTCNQYIAVAGEEDATKTAEVRFLRALQYYILMDAFGNIPFSETLSKPVRYTRAEMFDWLVKELTENVEPNLADAHAKTSADAGYGRVDKAAAWLLLARLYLNAEVYTGTAQWENAKTWANKVIASDYKLNKTGIGNWSAYQMLFMGDNGETSAAKEAIFPIIQNSKDIRSYGNSLFLMASTFNDKMHANPDDASAINGCVSAAWGGNRARMELVRKFFPTGDVPKAKSYDMPALANDKRAIFWGYSDDEADPVTLENTKISNFKNGYGVCKFVNFKTDGSSAYNPSFADADCFFMRAAEAYLIVGEADARLHGNQTTTEGTKAIDELRARAKATTRGETGSYSLDEICDEWAREFYFEGIRRPTLIRFGRYGGNNNYNWSWKGNAETGKNFDSHLNIFPIPVGELNANSNLQQNPGY